MGTIVPVSDVKEVALFGKRLHIVAESGDAVACAARQFLTESRYEVTRLEPIVPSLEDVLVSLIEVRDRAEQPRQEARR